MAQKLQQPVPDEQWEPFCGFRVARTPIRLHQRENGDASFTLGAQLWWLTPKRNCRFYGRRLNCEDPILACHDGSLRTGAVGAGAGCSAKTKAGNAGERAGPGAI